MEINIVFLWGFHAELREGWNHYRLLELYDLFTLIHQYVFKVGLIKFISQAMTKNNRKHLFQVIVVNLQNMDF